MRRHGRIYRGGAAGRSVVWPFIRMKTSPILNSPYKEPDRHFQSDDRGLTETVLDYRRPSTVQIPLRRPRGRAARMAHDPAAQAWSSERLKENEFVNKVRAKVTEWRKAGYPGTTRTTQELLRFWTDDSRENKLFFCQIEALETLIYINESAEKAGEHWILNELRRENQDANAGLHRLAFKLATGTGKTVVMAMVIAYNTLNKIRYPQDTRFTDTFVIVTPGITIRDRLNVLQPNSPSNYYQERDIVTNVDFDELNRANILIVNFQQMVLRQNPRFALGGVMKAAGLIDESAIEETPETMARRVFKQVAGRSRVIIINDEAHHCYQERPMEETLTAEERAEAAENNKAARVWLEGLKTLANRTTINAVIDLSATPYFLSGSGYAEGTLFPWVVYDFSLLDALESGVVKIPRLPSADDRIDRASLPEFRNLWTNIREELPAEHIPGKLEQALLSLYGSYEKYYRVYEESKKKNPAVMPPVMIVVCNNMKVSQLVYEWIAGHEAPTASGRASIEKGNLEIFRNEDGFAMLEKPNTLLVDSARLESGESVTPEFKKTFAREIEEFRTEYRRRFPGRDEPTDEVILREVMNTVGKPGRLGENIKCVVSVSMLTEGWDVNTVTHILGVRAFSTQLLCEQVVGRALRRVDYTPDENGYLREEYAEVYGVPFILWDDEGGPTPPPPPPPEFHRVKALPERAAAYEISFPRVDGYRYEIDEQKLAATFTDDSKIVIENEQTRVVLEGIIGAETEETMEKIRERREGDVANRIAAELLKRYYRDADGSEKYWLYPQLRRIVDEFVKTQVVLKDNMFIGYLSVGDYLRSACEKIQHAIVTANIAGQEGKRKLLPILSGRSQRGSTSGVDFLTTRPVYETIKSHLNYVVADTEVWEQAVAKRLEEMPEVVSYVKNYQLGFTIPYERNGAAHQYFPDYIAKVELPNGEILNLLIEVTGEKDQKKVAKVQTATELWVPAVNNHGGFGRWAMLEIRDIHETQALIRAEIAKAVQ